MIKIKLSESSERIFWSIAFPGFGQFLNSHIFKGVLFIILEFIINIKSNLNLILIESFYGDTESALTTANFQWLMFYPCVYMFAMWDAYKNAEGERPDFMYLPFAISAIISTIGVIYSPTFRVFGFLLGPVWLPIICILIGIGSGLVIRKLLIYFITVKKSVNDLQSYSANNSEEGFEDKDQYIQQLCKSELIGLAIYSMPDLVLIKANQTYLNFLEPPFNERCNSIGRRIDEIVKDWRDSPIEKYWKEAIEAGKTFKVNAYTHKEYCKGNSYWDSIVTPVLENGKAKYVVSNAQDVTEKVMIRRKIDEELEVIS